MKAQPWLRFLHPMGIDQNEKYDLDGQDHGDTNRELQMPCFMTNQIHSAKASNASAQYSNAHETSFRDAPVSLHRFSLIGQHKCKPCGIY